MRPPFVVNTVFYVVVARCRVSGYNAAVHLVPAPSERDITVASNKATTSTFSSGWCCSTDLGEGAVWVATVEGVRTAVL